MIICKTTIGYGSPHKAGTYLAHGEPLGGEEVRLTKQKLDWRHPAFYVPQEVFKHCREAIDRGTALYLNWKKKLDRYILAYPEQGAELARLIAGELPDNWGECLADVLKTAGSEISTRDASGLALNYLSGILPHLMGGAADLAGSTRTYLKGSTDFNTSDYSGRNIRFGLREHAMAAVSNGLALHGGVLPFAATFLIFSDYMRPAVRLAAIMKLPVIYVFTHDSIGLGQDGPTHQPVEHLMSLRLIPGLTVIRPADAAETVEAWRVAVESRSGPTALILSRQSLPVLNRHALTSARNLSKGAYILKEAAGQIDIMLIASGSEVQIALAAAEILESQNKKVRVISMPSWELFEKEPEAYRRRVLPAGVYNRIAIEAGATSGLGALHRVKGFDIGHKSLW